MHGGALQAALNVRVPSLRADSAAIYRALKQLEKDGDLEAEWDMSSGGPAICVYRLKPHGWRILDRCARTSRSTGQPAAFRRRVRQVEAAEAVGARRRALDSPRRRAAGTGGATRGARRA